MEGNRREEKKRKTLYFHIHVGFFFSPLLFVSWRKVEAKSSRTCLDCRSQGVGGLQNFIMMESLSHWPGEHLTSDTTAVMLPVQKHVQVHQRQILEYHRHISDHSRFLYLHSFILYGYKCTQTCFSTVFNYSPIHVCLNLYNWKE